MLLMGCSFSVAVQAQQTLAFPGAEGFGRYASGGRGGKVVTVTNLSDYASSETPVVGSLRWALDQYVHKEIVDGKEITVYEPLTVVFNVAGNIHLVEDLKVKRADLTIAGQTAPGQGVCITGHSMLFNGATGGELWYWGPRRKNVIVRYMRFRPSVPDSSYVTYGTDIENYENFILDHCTMTWANEECLAVYDNLYTTVQWCIASEGLYSANHAKGLRSYCGVWGGQFASYHHNLIAHNNSRNIRFNGARSHDTLAVVEYRNNVVYNWGSNNSGQGLEMQIDVAESRCELNMFNNYYKHGPASPKGGNITNTNKAIRLVRIDQTRATVEQGHQGRHYVEGNYLTDFPTVSADNWNYGVQFNSSPYSTDSALAHRLFRSLTPSPEVEAIMPINLESAQSAYELTLAGVGATCPARDWQDQRIVNETVSGTASGTGKFGAQKGIIDDPEAVGGWPVLEGTPYTDTDGDGIPDDWETAHGLNPNDAADGAVITASGYSNLELYINGINPLITALDEKHTDSQVWACLANSEVSISSDVLVNQIEVYTLDGRQILAQPVHQNNAVIALPVQTNSVIVNIHLRNGVNVRRILTGR